MNTPDYEAVVHFAHTWGLIFAFFIFGAAVTYALWPGNRFDEAARLPLGDETDD